MQGIFVCPCLYDFLHLSPSMCRSTCLRMDQRTQLTVPYRGCNMSHLRLASYLSLDLILAILFDLAVRDSNNNHGNRSYSGLCHKFEFSEGTSRQNVNSSAAVRLFRADNPDIFR